MTVSSSGHRAALVMIGVAVAARLARNPRSYGPAVVAVIAFVAIAGMGRESRARSFARLASWDKRRSANSKTTPT